MTETLKIPANTLHLAETASWRALLTEAQYCSGLSIDPDIEDHIVSLLYRHLGVSKTEVGASLSDFESLRQLSSKSSIAQCEVGDHALLFAGLFPESAIRQGIPLSSIVTLGQNAYRQHSDNHGSGFHRLMSELFVMCVDVLQTARVIEHGVSCIDGLNAYGLWAQLGSVHGWQVLRALTDALPAPIPADVLH